jgi:hypothetical protein
VANIEARDFYLAFPRRQDPDAPLGGKKVSPEQERQEGDRLRRELDELQRHAGDVRQQVASALAQGLHSHPTPADKIKPH